MWRAVGDGAAFTLVLTVALRPNPAWPCLRLLEQPTPVHATHYGCFRATEAELSSSHIWPTELKILSVPLQKCLPSPALKGSEGDEDLRNVGSCQRMESKGCSYDVFRGIHLPGQHGPC